MARSAQISAEISISTRDQLDEYVRATGVKKAHLIEQALLHHMRALQELPEDIIVPARIVVTRESGRRILRELNRPGRPTKKLRKLMSANGD